jgi:hypothetical protein
MFKKIRSLVGRLFDENQQMLIVLFLSDFFWFLRKYFLSVVINYPDEFLNNWQSIKKFTSQDKERNFTVYQLIKVHNQIFKNRETCAIEFGVDRGGTLSTICKFIKKDTDIFAIDSFGIYSEKIKQNVTNFDSHYLGNYKPFTKKTRFKEFDYKKLEMHLNQSIKDKNCNLKVIASYYPDELSNEDLKEISSNKYSFVHLDFDLYKPTVAAIKLIMSRLEKNAIILVDDYNFINQEGVKYAIRDTGVTLDNCIQTQSGQLIIYTS